MTALKPGEIEAVIRRGPDPRFRLVLVYGPDTGLVADRAQRLVKRMAADPDDPFSLVKLDGDSLAADPGRLVDEAGTIGLFGGSRTIWVRPGTRNYAPAVEAALDQTSEGARIVVEAGDLKPSAPLRSLCEKSPKALAIPCYADDAATLATLIDHTLLEHGLRIDRDARDLFAGSLGGDRRASLSEIEKLALYARGKESVEIEDVEAVASDVGASVLNTLIDAAFAGRAAEVEREYRRFRLEGLDPAMMLGAALRHALALLGLRLDHPGASAGALATQWRGLHFRRKALVEAQFARWSPDALRRAVEVLQGAVLACRRSDPDLAHAQGSAVLLKIAGAAAKARG